MGSRMKTTLASEGTLPEATGESHPVEVSVVKLRVGNDIVLGNCFRWGVKPGAMPQLYKYFGNPGLTAFLNTLFHAHFGDGY